jgi:hypothetical protein
MTINVSVHRPSERVAKGTSTNGIRSIPTDDGGVIDIYMDLRVAEATARAFNHMSDAVISQRIAVVGVIHAVEHVA